MSKKPRRLYAYRLHVTYPPTSHYSAEGEWNPNWEPANWKPTRGYESPESAIGLIGLTMEVAAAEPEFTWPVVKTYLSRKSADARAFLLESYGAKVTVEQSLPIEWPS